MVTAMEAVPARLRVDDGVPVAEMTETEVSADKLAGQLVVESVCGLDARESPTPCPLDCSSWVWHAPQPRADVLDEVPVLKWH